MIGFFGKFQLFLLFILPTTFMLAGPDGGVVFARAQEDVLDEDVLDEEDVMIETDDGVEPGTDAVPSDTQQTDDDEDEDKPLKASPDADTLILFTKPASPTDLPAGRVVKFMVGFSNRGSKDFIVETMDAAFRYPQDYSFYIQNFTAVKYNHLVEPQREATFEYSFLPSETFNARPFGLTINLNYKDNEGNIFQDAVFNETVNVVEPDEGLDGETFFLYVFLVALVVLLLVGVQQLLSTFSKKHLSSKSTHKPAVEMGTQNRGDIDFDWIPKENLSDANKSPRRTPKSRTSPRERRTKRNTGSAED